jgi:SAM-dependent methyltransferase
MVDPSGFAFETRDRCPACDSADVRTRYACRFDQPPIAPFLAAYYRADPAVLDGTYRLAQCQSCGTFFQAEVGNSALLETLYTDWVDWHWDPLRDPGYNFDVSHPRRSRDGHEIMAAARFLGRPLSALTTLDFGMGWAGWARVAASLGCDSVGFDLSPARLEFAARYGVRAPVAGETFDFINTEQVFEHVTDPREVIRSLAVQLAPAGILKISVPSQHGVERLLAGLAAGTERIDATAIMSVHPLEHVNCYSRAGLLALAADVALVPVNHLAADFAFLVHRDSLAPGDLRRTAKSLARPFYNRLNPRNRYLWFRHAR